jgi:aspartyl-tRNA synthetase
MEKYGSDKPDLRFGMELVDVTEVVRKSDFSIFKKAEQVRCLNAEKDLSRRDIDSLIDWAKEQGSEGLAWMRVTARGLESSIAKYFSKEVQKELIKKTGAKRGVLFFVADKAGKAAEIMARLRNELASRLNLIRAGDYRFCWVTDYPLFEWSEEENRWQPQHHMFTAPKDVDVAFLEKQPERVRGKLYDLVLNGVELGSGSIRINQPGLQERVMRVIGLPREEARRRFGFLMDAFRFGAPPHGGIGIGFDRTVALMCGFNDIREVIAFPKNKKAECPMDGSPSDVDDKQLKELHIKKEE